MHTVGDPPNRGESRVTRHGGNGAASSRRPWKFTIYLRSRPTKTEVVTTRRDLRGPDPKRHVSRDDLVGLRRFGAARTRSTAR